MLSVSPRPAPVPMQHAYKLPLSKPRTVAGYSTAVSPGSRTPELLTITSSWQSLTAAKVQREFQLSSCPRKPRDLLSASTRTKWACAVRAPASCPLTTCTSPQTRSSPPRVWASRLQCRVSTADVSALPQFPAVLPNMPLKSPKHMQKNALLSASPSQSIRPYSSSLPIWPRSFPQCR